MRILHLFLSVFLVVNGYSQQNITLTEAIDKKLVTVDAHHYTKGVHYSKPIELTIASMVATPLRVVVTPGTMFYPLDSAYQNITATQQQTILLLPRYIRTVIVDGCCTEPSDRGAVNGVAYSIAHGNDTTLNKLTGFIDSQKMWGSIEAQTAIWTTVQRTTLDNISGSDEAVCKSLRKYVAALTGLKPARENEPPANVSEELTVHTIKGRFEMNSRSSQNIKIAMFDKNNIVVKELYVNPATPPGPIVAEYIIDLLQYHDEYYYIKLLCNGAVGMEKKVYTRG